MNKVVLQSAAIMMAGVFATPLMAAPAKPVIAWMPASVELANGNAAINVNWNMWWGENGEAWHLYRNGTLIHSATLTANGNNAQSGGYTDNLTVAGSYNYVVSLCNGANAADCTDSAAYSVTVNGASGGDTGGGTGGGDTGGGTGGGDTGGGTGGGDTGGTLDTPAAPTIAWMANTATLTNGSVDLTVNWNMWWGTNGNLWKLSQNGSEVHSASLTPNGNAAQAGSHTVTVTATGDYQFVVSLCNTDGTQTVCNDSAATTVSVADGGTGSGTGGGDTGGGTGGGGTGGAWDPWTDLDFSHWPHPLKENNRAYTATNNKMVGAYFVEWGIYGRNYHPADIPAQNLTHIFYGFIPVCGPNASLQEANSQGYSALVSQCQGKADYEVVVHDKFAALEKSYPGDKWDQPIRGIFGELYRLKKTHPNVKIIPSVGGWTLSDPLYDIGVNAQARATFIASIIDFIKTYDFFDGIDIDWEYPGGGGANGSLGTPQDGDGFATLMKELREALDALSVETGRTYELTAAVNGGVEKLSKINWEQSHQYMDYINLMSYDYYGAWSGVLGNMTGIYDSDKSPIAGFNANDAVNYLLGRGVPAAKLSLGVASYGRGWTGVTGVSGNDPFTGTGGAGITGSWEKGIEDYKVIEAKYMGGVNGNGTDGFALYYDEIGQASYLWNSVTGTLISFDTPRSVQAKGDYVLQHQLGGVFTWEIDADNGNILNAMHEGVGHTVQ